MLLTFLHILLYLMLLIMQQTGEQLLVLKSGLPCTTEVLRVGLKFVVLTLTIGLPVPLSDLLRVFWRQILPVCLILMWRMMLILIIRRLLQPQLAVMFLVRIFSG